MAKILFLAQFAPTNGKKVIPLSSEEKFYAETYHLPICDILEKYGYDYVTSSDVKELIQNYAQYDLVWSVYNRLGFRNCEVLYSQFVNIIICLILVQLQMYVH